MIIDLLAVVAVLGWAVVGWRRGSLAMGLWLVALGAGWAAALRWRAPAGRLLAETLPLSATAASLVGAAAVFLAVAGTVRLLGRFLDGRRRKRMESGWRPSRVDRVLGAGIGAATAGVAVLALGWAGSAAASLTGPAGDPGPTEVGELLAGGALDRVAARVGVGGGPAGGDAVQGSEAAGGASGGSGASGEPEGEQPAARSPERTSVLRRSVVGRLGTAAAERTVEAAVRAAGGDSRTAATTAAVVSRPAEARAALHTLAGSELARELASEDGLREAFYAGDAATLATHPGVVRLLEDRDVRDALRSLRLVPVEGGSPEVMARELAEAVAPMGSAVRSLRGDPEFVAALERSRLRERLRDGDVAGLAGDPDVAWMVGRVREVLSGGE